jgi:hypothetical protein
MKYLIFSFLIFLTQLGYCRVFSMREGKFAGYFLPTYGTSSVGDSYFENESTATTFTKGFNTHLGGEFGFAYRSSLVAWLFGIEVIKPSKIQGTASTAGTDNYLYTADVSVYVPKIGIEFIFYENSSLKLFMNGSMGTASLTSKTQYSTLTIAPNTDFTIEGKGTSNLISYSMGGEMHWADNTTVVFALGYRILDFAKIKYLKDVTTSFTGAHVKGDQILKSDSSALGYDFTGTFVTLGLRFWIH